MTLLGRLLRHVAQFERDFRTLGARFAMHGTASYVFRRGETRIDMGRFGSMQVRRAAGDLAAIRMVISNREYDISDVPHADRELSRRYDEILASGKTPVIIDAGANIGAASVWFKHRFPRAMVIAVEPEPGNAALLRTNLADRGMVLIREAAIGAVSGFVAMSHTAASVFGRTARAERGIEIVTIAQLLAQVPDGALFVVKVDIEGFEDDLFATNIEWIDQTHALMIEPHDWMLPGRQSSHALQKAMGDKGFDLFIKGENLIYVKMDAVSAG